MSDIPRSNSVIRDGNVVVDRFFKMSNQTTTQDAIVAHQSASNGLDGNSFGTTSVQEEEIFVNCASFGGDAEDEADEVEENAYDVGSIDIMDGRAKMSVVSRDDTKHVDLEALKDQDGFCPGDMDALCVSKNNTIDGASKVPMGSDSSDLFVADEKKRDVKNSRFGWYLPKPKKRGAADVPPSLESDGSADGSSSINQCEAEMVICSRYHSSKDDAAQKRFKKRSSSWYPRIVRFPRINKRMAMKQSQGKAERAGFVSEEFQQMNAESLANITKEKDRGFFDGEESVAQEQLSVTTDDDIDQAIKNANLIDDEPIEQHDTRSQRSNGTARNKAFPTNMNGEMDSLASSHHSLKLSAKTGEDDIKFTSSIQFNKSSKIVGVGDCNLVSSQKSGVGKDMLSVCSQISREFLLKETSNDDESADSRHLRKSVDTQIVSLYSERSPKSILKEAASDSKSSAHESTHSPDQDVASVYSQRSQAASLREVAEVGIDDKSVASRLSRKSAGTNVVSLYSQRSRKSISKEAASDSKSSAHESKQSSDQDVASVYSQRSQAASLREVAEVGNDDKSVTSRLSRKSAGTNVVSLYSQRSGKSISKEAASDSKSSASESKQSSDQDVVSVFSQRSQAASLREVADVGNDDKSVASRLSRKSAGTSVVSLYSQRSRKSISKEAASDSKSSATESKHSSDQDVVSMYSHRSQVASLKEVPNESQSLATQNSGKVPDHRISGEARLITSQQSFFKEKSQKRCDDEVEKLTIASSSSKNITSNGIHNESDTNKPNLPPHLKEMISVSDSFNVDGEDHVKNREDPAPRSPERVEGKEEMKAQPLRRFLSELAPSKNRRVVNVAGDEEENVAPDGGPTSIRRISSDIPKTLLSRKQQSRKKGSKPFEISGSHLSQPCPSDITECTEDGEFNSFLRVVGSRDEAMEPIDESKDPSVKDSSYVNFYTENEEEDQTQSEEHVELDTKSITSVGASETISEEELEREKENEHVADSANAKNEDDENSEAKEGNKEINKFALMDGDPETAPKNNQKAGLTLGVGAFQYATRRISSDVLPGQKDNSNEEHKNLSRVGRSSQTTKSMKNSKPINVTAQKLESADASKNVSIAEVGEQSFEPLTKGDDKVGMTWPQKENVSKSESLSKPCQPNSCIPTKCILGSFGNRYGMKGRNGEEKRHSNGAENSRIEDKEGTHMYEYELSDQEVFEREEAQSESSSMVVCTEDDDQDHDATYVTKNDDSNIKDTAKPKKKLKSTFQFWKFQSKAAATRKTLKKNNMSNYKLGLASPNPAETKYDNEEDNLRGGGSQREGPASDKDSVSQREAADASSVESRESTMLKEEGNPNLFRKLKSMQFTDQSEVEKLLDERLDTVEAEPDKNANAVERKTKLPTGILKKNSRFSTGWRKDQKATEKNHFEKGDDESNASTVLFTLSAEGEPGFEVMPVLGLIET